MHVTNATKCILAEICMLARSEKCNGLCPHWLALHSRSGRHSLAQLPERYALESLKTTPVRESQSQAYRIIDAYTRTFSRYFEKAELSENPIKSLYLYSEETGTGKTTSASAILNEWLRVIHVGTARRGIPSPALPAYFLDVNEWQSLYNGFARSHIPKDIAEERAARFYRIADKAKNASFAVLDDIGVRESTEGFRGDLHDVINYRVTNDLPTVFTSNIEMAELEDVFDRRLYDRVRDRTMDVEFVGESKRGLK